MATSDADDFTERRYANLVEVTKQRFSFRRFGDDLAGKDVALWRHDIDFSPHRALALARIENERAVPSTYFVLLNSQFYNAFEVRVVEILKEIVALGHDVGLHYDASLVSGDADAHAQRLCFEANVLSTLIGCPIKCFSIHNPTVSDDVALDDETYAGLINATSPGLRKSFEYCSDSNGVWRFRSLHDVVADASVGRIYALTHAEWWTPQGMTPHRRLVRAVEGRATAVLSDYEAFLRRHRPEILGVSK